MNQVVSAHLSPDTLIYIAYRKYISYMTESNNGVSTIRISKKAKKFLEEFGNLSDTYETVIVKLAEHYKNCRRRSGVKK